MHILFICTGNTCRSPLAEALLREKSKHHGLDIEVRSAGVSALTGASISSHSAQILHDKGINTQGMNATSLHEDLVLWADLILTMTMTHKGYVIQQYHGAADKTMTLKEYVEDQSHLAKLREEHAKMAAELQSKLALNKEISEEEKVKWWELDASLAKLDISDPFGGSLSLYQQTAAELDRLLDMLIHKLKNQSS
ncbi:low molecular weight protein arginine phosphatase [Longirhabdus pacifica]|uniref:low molecular weight protein arginine phosphatase n=1 Tax=Longirhabdus pacifica TaxID=2305227 RepID=UPI0010091BE9|nr:low molecular weight protein arginine phosphatase [Longirhabdus pacifica]